MVSAVVCWHGTHQVSIYVIAHGYIQLAHQLWFFNLGIGPWLGHNILHWTVIGKMSSFLVLVPDIGIIQHRTLHSWYWSLTLASFSIGLFILGTGPWHWSSFSIDSDWKMSSFLVLVSDIGHNAPFRKISNSAQSGIFALILWRLVKGSFFCVF